MIRLSEISNKYNFKINKLEKKGNTILIDSDKGKYVIKKNKKNDIIDYLNSRNFNYYPEIIDDNEEYTITKYIENNSIPNEYKILDLIDLISLLHNKTTFYKEIDLDDYKEIYEDIKNNIEYLYSYYDDYMSLIETHIYMSPSEYFLARNMNILLSNLSYCKESIEKWYKIVEEKTKIRMVILHNNLKLDHFIKGENSYLISWDKSKIGIPIFDLYKLYKKHSNDFEFTELLKRYEREYPLLEEEKLLFMILINLPDKIELNDIELIKCKVINKFIISLKKANIIKNNYSNS